jgi:HAD superfamily hydrolase (TIGR01509 family)
MGRSGGLEAIEAVVFDMDGTLIDTSAVVPAAFGVTIRELGGPDLTDDEMIESYVLGPPAAIMRHFLERDVSEAELEGYHERLADEARTRHLRPYPGILEALEALDAHGGVRLGVFTNADQGNIRVLLGVAGIRDRFAVAVGADAVAPRFKPEPDGLLLACESLGVRPTRTAYVGDGPLDAETARRAGATSVAAGWGHQLEDGSAFDLVVETPTDLAPALGLT